MVTDEDVRIPDVYHNVEKYLSTYPLEEIDENMEVVVPPGAEPGDHSTCIPPSHAVFQVALPTHHLCSM